MHQQFISQLVAIAKGEVGTKEIGGNNLGPKIKEYQKATTLNPAAWPWCAAFVCWCIREWLLKTPGLLALLGIEDNETIYWRPKTAAAFGLVSWAKNEKIYITDEKELAKAGDIVVFDFSHTGIVVEDQKEGDAFIRTVEGNTNGKGERDSESGDGVWLKKRQASLVRAYIRILK
jgi:hypothetical protein